MSKLRKIFTDLNPVDITNAITELTKLDTRQQRNSSIEPLPPLLMQTINSLTDNTDRLFVILLMVLQSPAYRLILCRGEYEHIHSEMMLKLESLYKNYVLGYEIWTGRKYEKEVRASANVVVYNIIWYFLKL